MKCRVTCMVAGNVFYVECLARNYDEAKMVALAQHPNARIIGVTAFFSRVDRRSVDGSSRIQAIW